MACWTMVGILLVNVRRKERESPKLGRVVVLLAKVDCGCSAVRSGDAADGAKAHLYGFVVLCCVNSVIP